MSTLTQVQSAFTGFVGGYTPDTAGGEPSWKRYADPDLFMSRWARGLEHGAYACSLSPIRDIGEAQQGIARVRADWSLRVSYQLSPGTAGGKTAEEATVYTWVDRQLGYLFAGGGAQSTIGAVGLSLHLDAIEMSSPLDGWVWSILRGSTGPFYLSL